MGPLARLYSKRIVNVNVNVIVAGALALGITVVVMHYFGQLGLAERLARGGISAKLIIGALTFLVDLVADVAVYYGLHWLANHTPGRRLLNPAYANLSFVRDATLVQMERAALSPVLYIIALGGQHLLLNLDYSIAAATAISFAAGIATARILHTIWMVHQERRLRTRVAPASPQPSPPIPPHPSTQLNPPAAPPAIPASAALQNSPPIARAVAPPAPVAASRSSAPPA